MITYLPGAGKIEEKIRLSVSRHHGRLCDGLNYAWTRLASATRIVCRPYTNLILAILLQADSTQKCQTIPLYIDASHHIMIRADLCSADSNRGRPDRFALWEHQICLHCSLELMWMVKVFKYFDLCHFVFQGYSFLENCAWLKLKFYSQNSGVEFAKKKGNK